MEDTPLEEKWPTFTYEYKHEGKTWGLEIVARDHNDAQARIESLKTLRLLGEVKGHIPAIIPGANMLVRIICTIGNIFFRRT